MSKEEYKNMNCLLLLKACIRERNNINKNRNLIIFKARFFAKCAFSTLCGSEDYYLFNKNIIDRICSCQTCLLYQPNNKIDKQYLVL